MDLEKEFSDFREKVKAEFKKMKDEFTKLQGVVTQLENELAEVKAKKEKKDDGWF